jgi:hypothetical protein
MREQFVLFELRGTFSAFPLHSIRHFFGLKDVVNGSYVKFDNNHFFIRNYFNLPLESYKVILLLNSNKTIVLPETSIACFDKIVEYNKEFDIAIREHDMVLIYRSLP